MHVPRRLLMTAAACSALGLSATPAVADPGRAGPDDIVVTPETVTQGDTVTVTVGGSACRGTGKAYDAIVESNAFPRTRLTGAPRETYSVARPRIFGAVRPGRHTVAATCGGRTVIGGAFRVVAPGAAGGGVAESGEAESGVGDSAAPTAAQSPPTTPRHGVRAGLGGGSGRLNPFTASLGIGLVAASAAAGGYSLVRRPTRAR